MDDIEQMLESGEIKPLSASKVPVDITSEQIKKLVEHINGNFHNVAEEDPETVDLDKAQRNVAYSIGNVFTNYNGLLLQERHKLCEIQGDLKHLKAIAYDKIKRFTKYTVDTTYIKVLIEASEDVRIKQIEHDKQLAYVEFLKNTLNQVTFYSNGVKTMLQREELRARYGE
jgi:hypothetical protein